jgi:hypothetical protein
MSSNSDLEKSIDYTLSHGLVIRHPTDPASVVHAPFSLSPAQFPRSLFSSALALQPNFNTLVHRISLSHSFLTTTLNPLCQSDEFIRKSMEIYTATRDTPKRDIILGIHRSDYLINNTTLTQVELNTIAASFATLSSLVSSMHTYMGYTIPLNPASTVLFAFAHARRYRKE